MDRSELTFAQAEGAEPLPTQLQPKTISKHLSAMLWLIVKSSLDRSIKYHSGGYGIEPSFDRPWKQILETWWVFERHEAIDEFPNTKNMVELVKSQIRSGDYLKVFGFLEFLIRRQDLPNGMSEAFAMALEKARAPYRIVENSVVGFGTSEEAEAIVSALERIEKSGQKGAQAHLRNASRSLSDGDWSSAVRESIHAVESAARSVEPEAGTLEPALTKLERSGYIHPAMKIAFSKLYGYASDEEGVRHALIYEDRSKVSEADAVFMFGAYASFASYLLAATNTMR